MKKFDIVAAVLAFVLTGAFIGAIISLSLRSFPTSNEQLLTYMLGQLSGFVSSAIGIYFVRRAETHPAGTPNDPVSIAGPTVNAPPVVTREKENVNEEVDPRPNPDV